MDLLERMDAYKRDASWAIWSLDGAGKITDSTFPLSQASSAAHGRAMLVSLNPASLRVAEVVEDTPPWTNFHSANTRHNDAFLGEALASTDLWGAYMTDLHPNIRESNSGLVRTSRDVVALAVQSLVDQAKLLGTVELIVCVGKQSYRSVLRHHAVIRDQLGLSREALVSIPHYSGSNGRVHKRNVEHYRALILEAIPAGMLEP